MTETALLVVVKEGHETTIEPLPENEADAMAKGYREETALHLAAQSGHKAIVLAAVR